jgi:hypothetical protein
MKRVTRDMLKGACEEQLELFICTWPDGAEVTEANALKAAKLGFHAGWVAWKLLSHSRYIEYLKILSEEQPGDEFWRRCWLHLYGFLRRNYD